MKLLLVVSLLLSRAIGTPEPPLDIPDAGLYPSPTFSTFSTPLRSRLAPHILHPQPDLPISATKTLSLPFSAVSGHTLSSEPSSGWATLVVGLNDGTELDIQLPTHVISNYCKATAQSTSTGSLACITTCTAIPTALATQNSSILSWVNVTQTPLLQSTTSTSMQTMSTRSALPLLLDETSIESEIMASFTLFSEPATLHTAAPEPRGVQVDEFTLLPDDLVFSIDPSKLTEPPMFAVDASGLPEISIITLDLSLVTTPPMFTFDPLISIITLDPSLSTTPPMFTLDPPIPTETLQSTLVTSVLTQITDTSSVTASLSLTTIVDSSTPITEAPSTVVSSSLTPSTSSSSVSLEATSTTSDLLTLGTARSDRASSASSSQSSTMASDLTTTTVVDTKSIISTPQSTSTATPRVSSASSSIDIHSDTSTAASTTPNIGTPPRPPPRPLPDLPSNGGVPSRPFPSFNSTTIPGSSPLPTTSSTDLPNTFPAYVTISSPTFCPITTLCPILKSIITPTPSSLVSKASISGISTVTEKVLSSSTPQSTAATSGEEDSSDIVTSSAPSHHSSSEMSTSTEETLFSSGSKAQSKLPEIEWGTTTLVTSSGHDTSAVSTDNSKSSSLAPTGTESSKKISHSSETAASLEPSSAIPPTPTNADSPSSSLFSSSSTSRTSSPSPFVTAATESSEFPFNTSPTGSHPFELPFLETDTIPSDTTSIIDASTTEISSTPPAENEKLRMKRRPFAELFDQITHVTSETTIYEPAGQSIASATASNPFTTTSPRPTSPSPSQQSPTTIYSSNAAIPHLPRTFSSPPRNQWDWWPWYRRHYQVSSNPHPLPQPSSSSSSTIPSLLARHPDKIPNPGNIKDDYRIWYSQYCSVYWRTQSNSASTIESNEMDRYCQTAVPSPPPPPTQSLDFEKGAQTASPNAQPTKMEGPGEILGNGGGSKVSGSGKGNGIISDILSFFTPITTSTPSPPDPPSSSSTTTRSATITTYPLPLPTTPTSPLSPPSNANDINHVNSPSQSPSSETEITSTDHTVKYIGWMMVAAMGVSSLWQFRRMIKGEMHGFARIGGGFLLRVAGRLGVDGWNRWEE